VDLNTEGLDVVGTVSTAGEVRKIELNLVPSFIQSHGHGTDEGLHASCRLVVRRPESSAHVLVVKNLHLKGEVLLQILDDHHKEGKFDAEGALRISGTGDVVRGDVGSHNLQDRRLDLLVRYSLNVSIANLSCERVVVQQSKAVSARMCCVSACKC